MRDKALFKVTAEPEKAYIAKAGEKLPQPLVVKQGAKLTVPFQVVRQSPDAKVALTLRQISTARNPQQMPLTVNNGQPLPAVAPNKNDGTFVINVKNNAPPGVYSIVLSATAQIQVERTDGNKGKRPATVEQTVTPVIVQVVPTALAKVTAGPAGKLVGGQSTDIVVKVERLNEYAGEYKVKVILPQNAAGITAGEATIPAGKSEGKVTLKAAPDALARQMGNVSVQVTGMYEGKLAITAESQKFNVTVEKAPPPKKPTPKKK